MAWPTGGHCRQNWDNLCCGYLGVPLWKLTEMAKLLLPLGHGNLRCCCEQTMKADAHFSPLDQGPTFRDILVKERYSQVPQKHYARNAKISQAIYIIEQSTVSLASKKCPNTGKECQHRQAQIKRAVPVSKTVVTFFPGKAHTLW